MSYLFIQISSGPDDEREKFDNVGVGAHHPEPDADTTVTLKKKYLNLSGTFIDPFHDTRGEGVGT